MARFVERVHEHGGDVQFVKQLMDAEFNDWGRAAEEGSSPELGKVLETVEALSALKAELKNSGSEEDQHLMYLVSALLAKLGQTEDAYIPGTAYRVNNTAFQKAVLQFKEILPKSLLKKFGIRRNGPKSGLDRNLIFKELDYIENQQGTLSELRNTDDIVVSFYGSARRSTKMVQNAAALSVLMGLTVMTGGGPGVMLDGNMGALAGETLIGDMYRSIGAAIFLPFETPNDFTSEASFLLPIFKHFYTRKIAVIYGSDIVVGWAGGYGTWDEIWAVISQMVTGEIPRKRIILADNSEHKTYWKPYFGEINKMIDKGLLPEWVGEYITYAENEEEYVTALEYSKNKIIEERNSENQNSVKDYISHKDRLGLKRHLVDKDFNTIDQLRNLERRRTLTVVGPVGTYQSDYGEQGARLVKALDQSDMIKGANILVNSNGQFGDGIIDAADSLERSSVVFVEGVHNSTHDLSDRPNIGHVQLYLSRLLNQALTNFSNGIVIYPGGDHTLALLYELFTMVQTKELQQMPVILMGSKSEWEVIARKLSESLLNDHKTISGNDIEIDLDKGLASGLFTFAKDEKEAVDLLEKFGFGQKSFERRQAGHAKETTKEKDTAKFFMKLLDGYVSESEAKVIIKKIVANHESPSFFLKNSYSIIKDFKGSKLIELMRKIESHYGLDSQLRMLVAVLAKYHPQGLDTPSLKINESQEVREKTSQTFMGEVHESLLAAKKESERKKTAFTKDQARAAARNYMFDKKGLNRASVNMPFRRGIGAVGVGMTPTIRPMI